MQKELKPTNNKSLFHTLGGVLADLTQEKASANNAMAIAKIAQCMQNCLVHEVKRYSSLKQFNEDVKFREIEKEF